MKQHNLEILGEWNNKLITEFEVEKVFVKEPEVLREKLAKMISEGPSNLMVATDFDQTISSFTYKGKPNPATFSIFRQSELAPQEFRDNMQKYYEHYVPIEKDQSIKLEEKRELMNEWYGKVSQEFKNAGFSRELSDRILNESNIAVRYLFGEFLDQCYKQEVPFHIVSGGLDQVCQTILNSFAPINEYTGLTMTSNQIVFVDNVLTEVLMKVTATTKSQVLNDCKIELKNNTMLLGDLPSDYYMTSELNLKNQVSIGFIPASHEDLLSDHTKLFDITIMGDASYLIPLMILHKTFKVEPSPELTKLFASSQYDEIRSLF